MALEMKTACMKCDGTLEDMGEALSKEWMAMEKH